MIFCILRQPGTIWDGGRKEKDLPRDKPASPLRLTVLCGGILNRVSTS